MKIFEVRIFTRKDVIYVAPIRGFALFYHCSRGSKYVTDYNFEEYVKPLLLIHGVEEVVYK